MVRRIFLFGFLALTVLSGPGCRLCGRKPLFDWGRDHDRDRDPAPTRTRDGGLLREPMSATDPYIPPTDLPPGGTGGLPLPSVPESRFRVDQLNPKRELLLPEDLPGTASPKSRAGGGFLGEPQSAGEEREAKKVTDSGELNGYSKVKPGLASGRVPSATGLDRLKKAGYKTVAYLHSPGSDASSVRRDVEAKGLTFIDLPVSPEKLADGVRAFNDAVADKSTRPLFICDEDGVRTGSLWYLYFRNIEFANDDTARLLAAPLGLTEPPSVEQTTFWVAMRSYLATR